MNNGPLEPKASVLPKSFADPPASVFYLETVCKWCFVYQLFESIFCHCFFLLSSCWLVFLQGRSERQNESAEKVKTRVQNPPSPLIRGVPYNHQAGSSFSYRVPLFQTGSPPFWAGSPFLVLFSALSFLSISAPYFRRFLLTSCLQVASSSFRSAFLLRRVSEISAVQSEILEKKQLTLQGMEE